MNAEPDVQTFPKCRHCGQPIWIFFQNGDPSGAWMHRGQSGDEWWKECRPEITVECGRCGKRFRLGESMACGCRVAGAEVEVVP